MTEAIPDTIRTVANRAQCIYSEQQVNAAIDRLAIDIKTRLEACNPLLLCVLHGAVTVTEKLVARLEFPLQTDYIHASRYRNETSGGDLEWKKYPEISLQGRTVLIVDDILDEGITLQRIVEYCVQQQCKKVYTAVLINKIHSRKLSKIKADFVGLDADDLYLYGTGMDYKGYLRDAPGIFAVADSDL